MRRIETANNLFTDGDLAVGMLGTPVTAAWLNAVQEELALTVEGLGGILDSAKYNQLYAAIVAGLRGGPPSVAVGSGAANALTASFTPAVSALTDGMTLLVRAALANTTTTPTFTPNSGVIAAKTIVKGANSALVAGDIAGAGHWLWLQYDVTLDKWLLQNPAKGITVYAPLASPTFTGTPAAPTAALGTNTTQLATMAALNAAIVARGQIMSVSAAVAANALTLGLNPCTLDFRASTPTLGTVNTRTISAALSLVVPSGATLGTTSAVAARLALLAIDNAGTVELAVTNLAGGNNLDESGVISTTAISAAATSASTIYSATARTNVPYRVVGFVDTQATAGTWATAPALVQGVGGQALAALSSLGYGQTWLDVKSSRAVGTTYYNTTGRPILVAVAANSSVSNSTITYTLNGLLCYGSSAGASTFILFACFIVPPGGSYVIGMNQSGTLNVNSWNELR